jgi:bifunctional DNA-binding transcriptional regulator/antitoxin component of YhaV-PrlF toxin-antitoxin module
MPKIQQNGSKTTVVLPAETVRFLGWKAGDVVLVDYDKRNDSITLRRVNK